MMTCPHCGYPDTTGTHALPRPYAPGQVYCVVGQR